MLDIESHPGEGTTVRLWLPAAAIEDRADRPAQASSALSVGGRHILIVDDEEMLREVLVAGLEDRGLAVSTASGGGDALALLRSRPDIEALVSDFSMPGMDGVTLIHRSWDIRPGLPAALLTGYAPDDARLMDAGMRPGTFPVLRKPITPGELVAAIEALVSPQGISR